MELLDLDREIDYLIINQLLPGELNFSDLIEKIHEKNNKIKIIILLFKNDDNLKRTILSIGVYRVLVDEEIKADNILKIINTDVKMQKYNEEILLEINKIKNQNNKNNNKNKIKKYYKYFINFIKKKNNIRFKKNIITISGNNGTGKTVFSILFANALINYYNKILIIDFNYINNSIQFIKNNNVELINKINNKVYISSNIYIFVENGKFNLEKFKKEINNYYSKYDLIIFDTSSENNIEINKELINLSSKCFFITEANLIEINKSKKILEKYINKWKINNNKIKIIFNKYNKYSINKLLLKKIFVDNNILGFFRYDKKINLYINSNFKNIILKKYYKRKIFKLFFKRRINGNIKWFRKKNRK